MSSAPLDVVGIGSMAVDRVHRVPRILGTDEKGMMISVGGEGPVREFVGGVLLNQMGWAALFGLQLGLTGRQGDDERGRFLREAMDRGSPTCRRAGRSVQPHSGSDDFPNLRRTTCTREQCARGGGGRAGKTRRPALRFDRQPAMLFSKFRLERVASYSEMLGPWPE